MYEGTEADKIVDKKNGVKEGSAVDNAMDKAMEESHYKHANKLGEALNKTFHKGKAIDN